MLNNETIDIRVDTGYSDGSYYIITVSIDIYKQHPKFPKQFTLGKRSADNFLFQLQKYRHNIYGPTEVCYTSQGVVRNKWYWINGKLLSEKEWEKVHHNNNFEAKIQEFLE